MSKPLRLRIRGPNSTQLTLTLDPTTTYGELIQAIQPKFPSLTSIVALVGVPPTPIQADASALLTACGIRNGDSIIVQDGQSSKEIVSGGKWDLPRTTNPKFGRMVHYKIPGDNSCLFHAIGVSLLRTNPSKQLVTRLKQEIAEVILQNPKEWGPAELGSSPQSYITQMNQPSFWGGGIETAILSSKYECEISVVDYYSLSVTTFALRDDYKRRIYLLYNGTPTSAAHYDVLVYTEDSAKASVLSSMTAAQATQDTQTIFDSNLMTIFSPRDENALLLAKRIAELNHTRLVEEGKAKQRTWTEKDMIKKKPVFVGGSGTAGATNSQSTATSSTTTATTQPDNQQPSKSSSQISSQKSPSPPPAAVKPTPAPAPTKPASDDKNLMWSCPLCTLNNGYARTLCEACGTPRDGSAPVNHVYVDPSELQPQASGGASSSSRNNVRPPDAQTFGTLYDDVPSRTTSRASSSRPWACKFCTLTNRPSSRTCESCGADKDASPGTTSSQPQPTADPQAQAWTCPTCSTENRPTSSRCASCRTKKPDNCSIM